MRQIAILGILILSSFRSNADDPRSVFKFDDNNYCMEYSGKLVLAAKIAPKQYEVYYRDPRTGHGEGHFVLQTVTSSFESEGLINDRLWVKRPKEVMDSVVIKQNGLDKKFALLTESPECASKSADMIKHPDSEHQAKIKEEQDVDDEYKQNAAAYFAEQEEMKKHEEKIAQEQSLPAGEKRKLMLKKEQDLNAKQSKWDHMSPGEQVAMCKAKGIPLDVQTYCGD